MVHPTPRIEVQIFMLLAGKRVITLFQKTIFASLRTGTLLLESAKVGPLRVTVSSLVSMLSGSVDQRRFSREFVNSVLKPYL